MFEILNLWAGFREVVKFIENNRVWLDVMVGNHYLYETNDQCYGKYREVAIVRGPKGQDSME